MQALSHSNAWKKASCASTKLRIQIVLLDCSYSRVFHCNAVRTFHPWIKDGPKAAISLYTSQLHVQLLPYVSLMAVAADCTLGYTAWFQVILCSRLGAGCRLFRGCPSCLWIWDRSRGGKSRLALGTVLLHAILNEIVAALCWELPKIDLVSTKKVWDQRMTPSGHCLTS